MENRVRECREDYNERNQDNQITQAKMARLLGMTPQGYSKIELGKTKPDVFTAIRVARILKVKVDVLFVVPTEPIKRVKESFGFADRTTL